MRYFVLTADNIIKPATDVHRKNSNKIYFTVDNLKFVYTTHEEYSSRHFFIGTHIKHVFYYFSQESWHETQQIKYLFQFNEAEDEELSCFQSTDFNAGVMYNIIEQTAMPLNDCEIFRYNLTIPAIQLVPKHIRDFVEEEDLIKATVKVVTDHFEAVYGEKYSLDIYKWEQEKRHYRFYFSVTRKKAFKEMTITEIEEALGYKIKVIGD